MQREIYQNAIDEIVKADSPANTVWVEYDERKNVYHIITDENTAYGWLDAKGHISRL